MNRFFYDFGYNLKTHLKRSRIIIIFSCIFLILGIILGFFGANSNISFISILSKSDKLIFDYIKGTGSVVTVFFNKLGEFILLFALIYVFGLTIYTVFLNMLFIVYQAYVLTISVITLVEIYSINGLLNVIFLTIPLNLILFAVIILAITITTLRAYYAHKFNIAFATSFSQFKFMQKFALCFFAGILVCAVYSFVYPLLLKSFSLIVF